MLALLIAVTALAGVGWFSHWCAEDKIHVLEDQARDIYRLAARTEAENIRLRATVARLTGHPSTSTDGPGFVRTLAAVRALPNREGRP